MVSVVVFKFFPAVAMFTGRLKITVCGAKDLQHTNFMTRHGLSAMGDASSSSEGGGQSLDGGHPAGRKESVLPGLDPYVQIDVDEVSIERSSTKAKTRNPTWNETFTTELLRNANQAGFTVWHDATMPPDDFVANCKVQLADLIDEKEEQTIHDLWVRRGQMPVRHDSMLAASLASFQPQVF